MPEILTESFCERCGTRYTFESSAPRKTRRLGQIKTLSKGMKNWVMSDDTSLDEAMAAARNDEDRELSSQQLDAFHSTFNFCMTCRQYTCGNCWNQAEGRCLTCAPHLGHEILPAAFADQAVPEPIRIEAEAWPEVDLSAPGVAANGNGHQPGLGAAIDPWAGVGAADAEELPELDAAARLAFLSGETPLSTVDPETPAAAADEPLIGAADEPLIGAADAPPAWPAADEPVAFAGDDELPEPGAVAMEELQVAAAVVEPEPLAAEPMEGEPVASVAEVLEVADPEPVEAIAAKGEPVVADVEAGPVQVVGEEPVVADVEAEPIAAAATSEMELPAAAPSPAPDRAVGTADVGTARTVDLLRRFRPGQNIDAELAAFEATQSAPQSIPVAESPEPAAATAVEADAPSAPAPAAQPARPTRPSILPSMGWRKPAPQPESEIVAEPEPALTAVEPEPAVAVEPERVAAPREPEPVAAAQEPGADEPGPALAAVERVAAERDAARAEPEPVAAAPEPEPVVAAEVEPVAAEVEPVAAEVEQVAAEAAAAKEPAVVEPEPIAAAPEPVAVEPQPEPAIAAAVETPAPQPVAPAPIAPVVPESAPQSAPAPIAAEAPREDRVPQPTWQIYAPDATPAVSRPLDAPLPPATPVPPAQPSVAATADPQWPVRPDFAESPAMALLANRANRSPSEALWAASAREVLAQPANAASVTTGVQPCSSCGLSLSATARFCRRCGTRQG